ncbi:MAG: T9SS type A sorting domain-containing protein [Tannerella sp.]|jgi:hypothetical protein|nr:T9SS type A sorting domain-containing protein [Tannerella sp.]
MKRLYLILSLICLCIAGAAAQDVIWEKTAKNADLPAFFGTDNVRCATVGTLDGQKALFVVSYNTATPVASAVNVLNIGDGSLITTLTLPEESLLAEGHFPINAIGFTEDSVLFVASMAGANSTKKFNVYMWKTLTDAPKLMFSANPFPLRLGDEMVVQGKYKDGSARIYAPNFTYAGVSGKEEVRVLSLTADAQNAGEYVFAPDSVVLNIDIPARGTVAGTYYNSPTYIPMANGGYLWKYNNDSLYYQSGDGIIQVQFPVPQASPAYEQNSLVYMGMMHGRHYVAMLNSIYGRGEIYSFLPPTAANAGWVGLRQEYITPTQMATGAPNNGNRAGEVSVDWSGDKPVVYVLATNQGIGAYVALNISRSAPAPDPVPADINVLWERTRREGNMYAHFGPAGATSRWMAYGKAGGVPTLLYNSLYDPDWSEANIGTYAVDPLTGKEIRQLKKPSVVRSTTNGNINTDGTWQVASLNVSDDGKIFVTTRADSSGREVAAYEPKMPHFNIYKYDDIDADAEIIYSAPVDYTVSLGNKALTTGSYSDNTWKMYVPNLFFSTDYEPQQQEIYIFSLENIPGTGTELTYIKQMVECGGNRKVGDMSWWSPGSSPEKDFGEYSSSLYVPMADGSHFWMDSYDGLYFKPAASSGFRVDPDYITKMTNTPRYMGKGEDGKHYLAYFDYTPCCAKIVSYTDPALGVDSVTVTPPLYITGYDYPLNTNGAGDIAVNWEGDHPVVYVLSASLGIGAYEITSIGRKATTTGISLPAATASAFRLVQYGSVLQASGAEAIASIEVINLLGQRVASVAGTSQVSVSGLKGVYIVKITGISDTEEVKKILVK